MELCSTCKRVKCNKRIVVTQQNDLTIIKCLEYEKDKSKIQGYIKPLEKTARLQPILFNGFISDWSKF